MIGAADGYIAIGHEAAGPRGGWHVERAAVKAARLLPYADSAILIAAGNHGGVITNKFMRKSAARIDFRSHTCSGRDAIHEVVVAHKRANDVTLRVADADGAVVGASGKHAAS